MSDELYLCPNCGLGVNCNCDSLEQPSAGEFVPSVISDRTVVIAIHECHYCGLPEVHVTWSSCTEALKKSVATLQSELQREREKNLNLEAEGLSDAALIAELRLVRIPELEQECDRLRGEAGESQRIIDNLERERNEVWATKNEYLGEVNRLQQRLKDAEAQRDRGKENLYEMTCRWEAERGTALRCHDRIATLEAQLDTANGYIGEFTNTPAGALIAARDERIEALEAFLARVRKIEEHEAYGALQMAIKELEEK